MIMRPMDPQQGPPPFDLIGQTIGNYLVTQKLGEGGMGSVYLAEHPSIGKKVALKVLHSEFSSNQEVATRFFNEAKAVNDIGHPNIVDIVDFGIIQGGIGREQLVYFIMEYLAGSTLSHLIRTEAPLAPERALSIALQVADALGASHKCGIVHRDLKPDNVILVQRHRDRDFVKILDFGIAKLTNEAQGSQRTRTGIVMGTPAYMSPEQCEGRGGVDHRTDIYALGIVIYEMLVGRVPFIGEGYGEILVQHLTQRPLPPSSYRMTPPHVEAVVLKALEKRPELRFPTMDEFMRAMADPVGFVESHGGVGGFLQRQLMPSSGPMPNIRMTPAPSLTPVPGSLYGHLTPPPTTLGSAVGQVAPPPQRSRAGFVIAAGLVVAAAVAGIVIVVGHKDKTARAADTGSQTPGSAVVERQKDVPKNVVVPKDVPVAPGSAAARVGSGSAAGSGDGSAVTAAAMVDLKLETTPPGADVFIDGKDMGVKTNAIVRVLKQPKGTKAKVELRLKGYVTVEKDVDVDQNADIDKNLVEEKKVIPRIIPHNNGKGSGSSTPTITTKPDGDGLMRPGD
jgi:serine/threonine-protein kinase